MNQIEFRALAIRTRLIFAAHQGPGHDVWYEAGPTPPHPKSRVVCECGDVLLRGSEVIKLSMRQLLTVIAFGQELGQEPIE